MSREVHVRLCESLGVKFPRATQPFGRCYSPKTGRAYIGTVPSKLRVIRICEAISEMTGRDQTLLDQEMVVAKLNRTMIRWANYFCLGPVSKAYQAVESHASKRLRQWLCAKHKERWPGTKRFPQASLRGVLGLVRLTRRRRNLPWATS
jgi:RNA-directed DNA polymerase